MHKHTGNQARNKRQYSIKSRRSDHTSVKSDNRVVCPKTGRRKFLYPTLKKAELACSYSNVPQRPYYCKRCMGFHTTSKTKDEYYDNLAEANPSVIPERTKREYNFVEQNPRAIRRKKSDAEIKTEVKEIMKRAYDTPATF